MTSVASTETKRLNKAASVDEIAKAFKERKRLEQEAYKALPTVTIECPIHGTQVLKVQPGTDPESYKCPFCVQERVRREGILSKYRQNKFELIKLIGDPLSPMCEEQTFENYRVTETADADKAQAQSKAYVACQRFAEGFAERLFSGQKAKSRVGILMHGHFGNGKTHLASAICNVVKAQGFEPIYLRAITLFNTYKGVSGATANAIAKHLAHVPLLVIDELGRSTGSEFECNQLIELIDARAQLGHPTILITNLDGKGYKDLLGGAVASRTQTIFYPLQFQWADFRKGQRIADMEPEEVF